MFTIVCTSSSPRWPLELLAAELLLAAPLRPAVLLELAALFEPAVLLEPAALFEPAVRAAACLRFARFAGIRPAAPLAAG